MPDKLRILILEDVPTDAALMERELRQAGISLEARRVETREDFLRELDEFKPDIVLADYALPQFSGMEALGLAMEHFPPVPVVVVTGSTNEEIAVECMKRGASDYVIKEHLARLSLAVTGALEAHRTRLERERLGKAVFRSAEQWKSTFDAIADGVCVLNLEGNIERCNAAFRDLAARPFHEMVGRSCCEIMHGSPTPVEGCPFVRMKETGRRETEVFNLQGRWCKVMTFPRNCGQSEKLVQQQQEDCHGFEEKAVYPRV